MNNSIFAKNRIASKNNSYFSGINFNDLSATSSAFMSNIRPNMRGGSRSNSRSRYMYGGVCPCNIALKAFEEDNVENALDIVKEGDCCFECEDSDGNTILHHLVLCSNANDKCVDAIKMLIDIDKISKCINKQNKEGKTPMLLAVTIGNETVANMLDDAGADKSIKDNEGNFVQAEDSETNEVTDKSIRTAEAVENVAKLVEKSGDGIETSIDLGTETVQKPVESKNNESSANARVREQLEKFINSALGNLLITREINDKIKVPLVSRMPGPDSEIEFISQQETDASTMDSIKELLNSSEKKSEVVNTSREPETIQSETDELIQVLAKKYSEGEKKNQENKVATELGKLTEKVEEKVEEKTKEKTKEKADETSDAGVESSVDTEALMQAISKISGNVATNVKEKQDGGSKQKIMGYRNLNLSESSLVSESFNINSYSESEPEYGISDTGYAAFYNDSEYGAVTNELSRMMQRQRDNLHQQVLDMIMAMLNKGELVKDSVAIKASERNAKLIKAYIYRKVSEKNPQMGGLDKILSISKMSEQQISDLIEDMPDLDELEKTIQKNIEERQAERAKSKSDKSSKSSKKSKDESESETINFTMTETTESETPKKKSSKTKDKETKSKAKKTSKK